jgi:hypothetical protein
MHRLVTLQAKGSSIFRTPVNILSRLSVIPTKFKSLDAVVSNTSWNIRLWIAMDFVLPRPDKISAAHSVRLLDGMIIFILRIMAGMSMLFVCGCNKLGAMPAGLACTTNFHLHFSVFGSDIQGLTRLSVVYIVSNKFLLTNKASTPHSPNTVYLHLRNHPGECKALGQ